MENFDSLGILAIISFFMAWIAMLPAFYIPRFISLIKYPRYIKTALLEIKVPGAIGRKIINYFWFFIGSSGLLVIMTDIFYRRIFPSFSGLILLNIAIVFGASFQSPTTLPIARWYIHKDGIALYGWGDLIPWMRVQSYKWDHSDNDQKQSLIVLKCKRSRGITSIHTQYKLVVPTEASHTIQQLLRKYSQRT
jgi:hypothetical protein